MAHKKFNALYGITNKHLENIDLHLLTNWVQHEKVSDEQLLDDYDSDPSTYSPSLSSHAEASWKLEVSSTIQLLMEQSGSCCHSYITKNISLLTAEGI